MTLVFFWLGKSALNLIASNKARQYIRPHRCDLYSEIFYIVKRPAAYIGAVTIAEIEENMADIAFLRVVISKIKVVHFLFSRKIITICFQILFDFLFVSLSTNVDVFGQH